jgi:hypothetical protein
VNFYRISVGAHFLSMWSKEDAAVLCNARITARLTGQAALVVQVLPNYRVVAAVQPNEQIEEVTPVRGSLSDQSCSAK